MSKTLIEDTFSKKLDLNISLKVMVWVLLIPFYF